MFVASCQKLKKVSVQQKGPACQELQNEEDLQHALIVTAVSSYKVDKNVPPHLDVVQNLLKLKLGVMF